MLMITKEGLLRVVMINSKDSKILIDGSDLQRLDVTNTKGLARTNDLSGIPTGTGSTSISNSAVQKVPGAAGVNISDAKSQEPKLSVFFLNNDKTVLYFLSKANSIMRVDLTSKDVYLPTKGSVQIPKANGSSKHIVAEIDLERASRHQSEGIVVSGESFLYLMGYEEGNMVLEIFPLKEQTGSGPIHGIKHEYQCSKLARIGLVEAVEGMAILITVEPIDETKDDNLARITLSLKNLDGKTEHKYSLPHPDDKPFEYDAIDIQEQSMNKTGYGNMPMTLVFLLVSNNSNSDLYYLCVAGYRVWLVGVFRELFSPRRDRTPFHNSLLLGEDGLLAVSAGDRQVRKYRINKTA
jgi:hypothetical protein